LQPEPEARRIATSAKLYTQAQLCFILDTLLSSYSEFHKSPMQRVSLEAMLLKILRSKHRIPLEVLARRLSELEEKLMGKIASAPARPETPSIIVAPVEKAVSAPLPVQPEPPAIITPPEEKPVSLEPVPFNPYQPAAVEETPRSPLPPIAELQTELSTTPEIVKEEPPQEGGLAPMHTETLLRFAAVELEGTILIEK
jgi:DNA polymerase III gamma/tau subunit